jgi:N6-L-threonylcarbamoyladenine synthase
MAAVYSAKCFEVLDDEFMAFHISGGTTELVRVTPRDDAFLSEIIGGTKDLNAGQVIDRIGVKMGLPFPAGSHIERLALENTKKIPKRKISRQGTWLNLSGLENIALKLYDETKDERLVCAFVLDYIGRALCEVAEEMVNKYGERKLVCAGGVMCNSIIKKMISERFDARFAVPAMSADNAVGVAALTARAHFKCV